MASHGWLNRARYELQKVTTVLPKQRTEDGKASGVVGRVELQLRRSNGNGDGVGNGQRPSPKARMAQRKGRRGSRGASRALFRILLAVVQRQAYASSVEQWRGRWSAAAAVGERRRTGKRNVSAVESQACAGALIGMLWPDVT